MRSSLRALSPAQRAELLQRLSPDVAAALARDWEVVLARDKQLPPPGPWRAWMILAGRGFGKTRTGAEWVLKLAREGQHRIIHLIGATAADVRDVMIEGPSGILSVAPPDNRPVYQPSKRRLVWSNGVIARTFSAEKPRQLRGPQCHAAWADELAAWQYEDAWAQLKLGLRLGNDPKVCVTTTPRPTKIIRALLAAPSTAITRGTTYENRTNLAEDFFSDIITEYEGTRLGRQELLAEVLTDTPGALWTLDLLDRHRVTAAPSLRRVAVAVDPAASSGEGSAETGIVGGGVGENGHGYLLADRSRRGSPEEWGSAAVLLHDELEADFIVAESNQGGDMVASVIRAAAAELHRAGKRTSPHVVVKLVHASRGKHTRAEPVAQLDEQGRIHHVGAHATLEDQMTTWDAAAGMPSPDRMDARVWLFTALMVGGAGAADLTAWAEDLAAAGVGQRRETADDSTRPPSERDEDEDDDGRW